jgi:FkbM family methyltransferase
MVATFNPNDGGSASFSPSERLLQAWKRIWLAWMGITTASRVSLVSPNPGEQAWYISPQLLSKKPVVISLGLSDTLSFDLGMIDAYQAEVYGFDPTDFTRAFLQKTPLPANFHYFPLAVAGHEGWLNLFERHGKGGRKKGSVFQKAPCRRLSGICRDLGLLHIDILKMDIEGSEYDVLEETLLQQIFPAQIAVEFHHRFEEIGIQKTRQAHRSLRGYGYRLAHISPWAEEFLYVRGETRWV